MTAKRKKRLGYKTFIHIFFILFSLSFIIPFLLVVSISFSSEEAIDSMGYGLIPRGPTLKAYQIVFKNPQKIIKAYEVTAFQSVLGTLLSVLVMSLCAYPLSRRNFKFRKPITFIIFFTMLFGGGLIPSYILNTQYYKLGNTIWIYIFPGLVSAWYIIIFRTFFQGLPESLPESAKIDGASELKIFFWIILPLSKPVLASIALFGLIDRWNDWYTALIYIRNEDLYTLQYLLQRILREAEFVRNMARDMPVGLDQELYKTPTESLRYAMLVVAAGPMVVVFPFFQKYFSHGLTIGAVKG